MKSPGKKHKLPDMKKKLQEIKKTGKISREDVRLSFKTKSFRAGGYSVAAAAIVIAIALAVNVFAGALPSDIMKFDTTSNNLFEMSEQTENLVSSLDTDIDIYWIVQSGQEDSMIEILLERYEDMSDRIKVTKKDPDVYPTFAQKYTQNVSNNSLVVESGERYRYIDSSSLYQYSYNEYSYDTSFSGESEVTSAIDYVLSDSLPKVYLLTGHGESELPSSFENAVEKENIETQELSLLSKGSVPKDADCVAVCAPQSDISVEEKDMLMEYLEGGGNMFLITNPPQEGRLENLEAVMEYYGVKAEEGIVIEGSQSNYALGTPYYLLPDIESHTITAPLNENGYYVLLPVAQGLKVMDELRESLSVTELLTTSDSAYSKIAGYDLDTYEKEEGDIDGPFTLSLAVTEVSDDDETETDIVWVSSAYLLDEQTNTRVSGGNQDFFLNALSWMCEPDESSISIHAKNLSYEYLTMSSGTASVLTLLIVFIIPAGCLGTGIYVWIRRKRR